MLFSVDGIVMLGGVCYSMCCSAVLLLFLLLVTGRVDILIACLS